MFINNKMNSINMLIIFSVLTSYNAHAMYFSQDTKTSLIDRSDSSVSDIENQKTTVALETGVAIHNSNSVKDDPESPKKTGASSKAELQDEIRKLEEAYRKLGDGITQTRAARINSGCLSNGSCGTFWAFEGNYFTEQIEPLHKSIGESIQDYKVFLQNIDNQDFTQNDQTSDEITKKLVKVKSDNKAVEEAMNTSTFKNGPQEPYYHWHNPYSYSATAGHIATGLLVTGGTALVAAGKNHLFGSGDQNK